MSKAKNGLLNLLQCGSCTFREREKIFEKKCSELGKLPSARACPSHTSDAFSLINTSADKSALGSLSEIIHNYGVTELNALASLLLKEKQTRRLGYHFYQKVFVRIRGQVKNNYFSNFVTGHILDASKETVRIAGFSGKNVVCVYAINEPNSSTFYTVERFQPIRQAMIEAKAFVDPELAGGEVMTSLRGRIGSLGSPDYEDIIDNPTLTKGRLKRAPKDDLVSLVAKLARGHIRSKKEVEGEIKII